MLKLFKQFAAIALCIITLTTMGSAPSQAAPKKQAISINSTYDFESGIYPFPGTFEITGAFETSGTVTMEVVGNPNSQILHCLYRFEAPEGTIIIREQCVFAAPFGEGKGRWEIVSGTGAYEGLRGNGSALMPVPKEIWIGFIY